MLWYKEEIIDDKARAARGTTKISNQYYKRNPHNKMCIKCKTELTDKCRSCGCGMESLSKL